MEGILSAHVLVDDEERDLYASFCEAMQHELRPRGDFESLLADRIISTAWRLRRVIHVETLMLEKAKNSFYNNSYRDAFVGNAAGNMATLSRYERSLEIALYRAMKEFKSLKEQVELEIFEVSI